MSGWSNWKRQPYGLMGNEQVNQTFSDGRLQGTKYLAQGAKAQSLMQSLAHGEQLGNHIEQTKKNWGNGFVKMTVHPGANGKINPVNIGGRIFTPEEGTGNITLVDSDFLDQQLELHKDKMTYINSIIERASISNDLCQLVTGLNDPEFNSWFGPKGQAFSLKFKDSGELHNVDARPDSIACYDETSLMFSQAINKFRIIIAFFMPILSKLTPDKIVDDNTPPAK